VSLEEDLDEEDFERAAASWQKARSIPVRVSHEYYMAQLVKDPIEAAKLARAEAVKGLTVAQFAWGHMLLNGHGTARDPEAAFRWFQIAARSGDPESLNMVGRCYQRGWGIAEDPAEAARFFRSAADKSDPWGQYNLAELLVSGTGVAQDYRAALPLLIKSARQGNEKAMNMLGHMREEGWGVRVKIGAAQDWYRRAAMRGCCRGQFNFSRFLCALGKVDEAAGWLRRSLLSAHQQFRDEIIAALRDVDIPEIRKIVRETEASAKT
jgi:TPR repeat protein